MKVRELIKELQKLPPALDVYYFDRDEDPVNIAHVHEETIWEDADGNVRLEYDDEHTEQTIACGLTY